MGLLVMGLLASLLLVASQIAFPDKELVGRLTQTLRQIDFTAVVMICRMYESAGPPLPRCGPAEPW